MPPNIRQQYRAVRLGDKSRPSFGERTWLPSLYTVHQCEISQIRVYLSHKYISVTPLGRPHHKVRSRYQKTRTEYANTTTLYTPRVCCGSKMSSWRVMVFETVHSKHLDVKRRQVTKINETICLNIRKHRRIWVFLP